MSSVTYNAAELLYHSVRIVFSCVLMDVVLFLCVDQVCKKLIDQCRNPTEKKNIWMFEAVILLLLSCCVYYYDHTPVVLILLCLITFISASLTGKLELSQVVDNLISNWREYNEHEEGLEEMNQTVGLTESSNQVTDAQIKDFMRNPEKPIINTEGSAATSSGLGEGLQNLRYNPSNASYEYVGPSPSGVPVGYLPEGTASKPYSLHLHRRRPLHTDTSSSDVSSIPQKRPAPVSNVMSSLAGISNKFKTAWGGLADGRTRSHLPPGLPNPGRNLCFLNSVLQCIARAPNLADELSEDANSCRSQDKNKLMLLDAASESLQKLNIHPAENDVMVIEVSDILEAACRINPGFISGRGVTQHQQDACEFLTWLLSELHDTIIDNKAVDKNLMDSESMSALKTVYGNISENHSNVMKQGCRAQIATANGISDPSLVEPVQNLANLEWLSHKRKNSSVIDDLFTMQCIGTQMCQNCKTVTVSIQTQNILSLAVPKRNQQISLYDCLSLYGSQETLEGKDGLHCDKCQAVTKTKTYSQTPRNVLKTKQQLASLPVSPIVGVAETSQQQYAFLSSTPVSRSNDNTNRVLRNSGAADFVVTNGLRQCLLRRLSECVIIQLMRFSYDPVARKSHKIQTPVSVQLTDLDFSEVVYDNCVLREDMSGIQKNNAYNLYGLCVHIGSDRTVSGHYLAYCKAADGQWYKFDDETVTLVPNMTTELQIDFVKENCYVLFYRRHHDELKA